MNAKYRHGPIVYACCAQSIGLHNRELIDRLPASPLLVGSMESIELPMAPPAILCIAGSDSGGGSGIQADIMTCAALECRALSVLTAVTSQSPSKLRAIAGVAPHAVAEQMGAALDSFPVRAMKSGLLHSTEVISILLEILQETRRSRPTERIPLIVDPVLHSGSGTSMMGEDTLPVLKKFLRMATLLTPNLPEAEVLLGYRIQSYEAMREASMELERQFGAAVLLKGGHCIESESFTNRQIEVRDIFCQQGRIREFKGERLPMPRVRGTGCSLSTAIACCVARSAIKATNQPAKPASETSLEEAISTAREYLFQSMKQAYDVGSNVAFLNHFWKTTPV